MEGKRLLMKVGWGQVLGKVRAEGRELRNVILCRQTGLASTA